MFKFKIVYCDSNGDLLMEPTVAVCGQDVYLKRNEIKKNGYRFKGWYAYRVSDRKLLYIEEETNEKRFYEEGKQPEKWVPNLFHDGEDVFCLSEENDDVIIMRAQWEEKKCLINAPEHVEDNKEILREKLLHRPIVLFGNNDVYVKNFHQKYHNTLNIRCVLTNKNVDEKIELSDGTIVTAKPYSKDRIRPDDFIIVCKPDIGVHYENAKKALDSDGLEHMNNYMRYSHAEVILDGKKLWLWMGYCQFSTIIAILNRIDNISKDYIFDYMRPGLHTVQNSYKFQDCQDMLKICDFLVYTPLIFSKGKMDFDYREFLPKDAKTLSIPRIEFRGYYPYKDSDLNTKHKYVYDKKLYFPFRYAENALDDLILKGLNDDEIYEEVMREDFIDEASIQKNLKLAFKSIEISESTADIKILDYIKENLTDHMLYRDGLHYHNDLFFELARRVCKYWNMDVIDDIDSFERKTEEAGTQYADVTETPVLPCVAKVLGLAFATDDKLWRVRCVGYGQPPAKGETRLMTRKEWIYAYLAYTRAQMTLSDLWNLKNE